MCIDKTKKMVSVHILDICLLAGTSVAFVLLAIGFSIPDWLYVTYRDKGGDESSLHMSIWYTRLCPGDRTCITTLHRDIDRQLVKLNLPSYKEFVDAIITMTDSKLVWTAWQPLTTLSVTFSLIGLGFAIGVVCHFQSSKVRYHKVLAILGCFVMLATSALMWIPVIMMAVQHKALDSDLVRIDTLLASISSSNIRVWLHSPSGLIVSAIGAFLAFLNAFVFLTSLLRRPTRDLQVNGLKEEEVVVERERKPTYPRERKSSSANVLDITLLVFSSLALLTLIVGFLLPDWMYVRYTDGAREVSTLRMSIWYNILCPTKYDTCEGVSYGSLDKKLTHMNNQGYKTFVDSIIYYTDGDLFWKTWQILATISVLMAFIGLLVAICLICYVKHYSSKRLKLVIVLGCVSMMTASILMWLPLAIITTINLHLQSGLTAINTDLSTTANRGIVALLTPSGLIVTAVGDLITFITAMLFLVYLCRSHEGYRKHVTESVGYLDLTDSNQVQCVLQPDDRSKFMVGPYLAHHAYIPQPKYLVQPVPVYTPQPLVKYVPRSHTIEDYMQTPTLEMSYAISNPMHQPYPHLHTGRQHSLPSYFAYYDGFSYA